jgi:hypothetical protein
VWFERHASAHVAIAREKEPRLVRSGAGGLPAGIGPYGLLTATADPSSPCSSG